MLSLLSEWPIGAKGVESLSVTATAKVHTLAGRRRKDERPGGGELRAAPGTEVRDLCNTVGATLLGSVNRLFAPTHSPPPSRLRLPARSL